MSLQALEALVILITPESVRECVTEIRRDPAQLDAIAKASYDYNDPSRQLFRRAMRYAVETPDIEWVDLLRASSASASPPGPLRSEVAAPSPGSSPGQSSAELIARATDFFL